MELFNTVLSVSESTSSVGKLHQDDGFFFSLQFLFSYFSLLVCWCMFDVNTLR